ncbi:bifunctional phosphoribosylaminoimidazolecarboxamide formyltransferase/IMP cyclohydrolase [Oceanirhabdus seepicola]|uniref:Bifunctional purine biosynthesis protein PurH n=1 Tax=Oceanirhabdus seepicola TaxID=2828781 RepID=A0A9J6P867_9CLOT|nr:bifunctional phosphoribosylaminoimidazolecarboxamide formyltransferase/IMP cyclohydrolase [Oceanirhabdus seepicola]MCM1992396.1 bifunctional phosphoribosylaminoimidazolecarboxamide formyltransferase/IMP cyclohydrolase [Oceanirhabdus seepicola]
MKRRALISVFDKSNVEKIAEYLEGRGYEILSTGGTYRKLKECGVNVTEVSEVTGSGEMLGGRVKSLHPVIHGGILANRAKAEDMSTLEEREIAPIDIVIVNLYPFFAGLKEDKTFEEMVELIDIGGPTMLRSAAKNFKDVLVVVDPQDYDNIINEFEEKNEISYEFKKEMARKVFNVTSSYDAAISEYMNEDGEEEYLSVSYKKEENLRYGENSHQDAALYLRNDGKGVMNNIEILGGKKLSYNNIKDLDIAWKVVWEFDEPACCSLKHNTPCGAAIGENSYDAYMKAYNCDPISIFGGIIAFNRKVDKATAEEINKIFVEIVIAPDFEEDALAEFSKKKNLRVLKCQYKPDDKYEYVSVDGAMLRQTRDEKLLEELKYVTENQPSEKELEDMIFGMKICKYVKSNAIVVVKDKMAKGVGAGQVNRIWAACEALDRAGDGAILASDAFFPFSDVVEKAGEYGIKGIIQPGGSIKDKLSIEKCEELGISMVFTGLRHFKH